MITEGTFLKEVAKRKASVDAYLHQRRSLMSFKPTDIQEASLSYFGLGGKYLRPAVLLFSCGAVGGDERQALPVAAAVEVYHTWTLVHDDIIDRDTRRRGGETVHERFRCLAQKRYQLSRLEACHYGLAVGILAGDLLQGWMVGLLSDLCNRQGLAPELTLSLIQDLELDVHGALIEGELLDVQFGLRPLAEVKERDILHMVEKKTGALFGFAGKAGAKIGLSAFKSRNPWVNAVSSFCKKCGVAFQLQDDILGIVGEESKIGKAVGADFREGKKTIPLAKAWQEAGSSDRKKIARAVGRKDLPAAEGKYLADLVVGLGGISYTQAMARGMVQKGMKSLSILPESRYKELLVSWADFLIQRSF